MQLKTLLNSTTDRLEYEMRRADAVQRRAEYAETLVKQANERIASMTASRHQMELTLTQVTEELKRYKQQLEKTEMEVHQAQLSIDDLEYEKKSIEREARQAKEVARQFEKALSESDARERSRQESQKSAAERYVDGVIEGRMEGWKTAKKMERENRKKIYTAGFEAGRMEGFEAGNSRGRAYERRNAMEPFDKFLDSEGYSDESRLGPSRSFVGVRRKGPKTLPRLPPSAFSPPNSGTSERFPLPPSPSTTHPVAVIDGYVSANEVLQDWKENIGHSAPRKVNGIVLALPAGSSADVVDQIVQKHPSLKILSVILPIDLNQGPLTNVPNFGAGIGISLSLSFVKNTPQLVEGVKWALKKGYIVDIDVPPPVNESGEGWEGLEELLSAVLGSSEEGKETAPPGAIVLSNILPPPHDLNISIVKLLNHPAYRAYQSNTASLSLFPSVYVKYTPPRWNAPTPAAGSAPSEGSKEKQEWKRRIKMYLGPSVEAFGYQRIIYGSSTSTPGSDSSNWYEIARESLAELGIEQEDVDAVFGRNALTLYGA
ncbi:hypothetical protein K439DRAFT_1644488 [Ramaria rubella]|nr:hypothetical protein K439DRAFT_1644488 [Ramaria rubella]